LNWCRPSGRTAPEAQALADVIGAALGADEGTTWVRVRVLDRADYAESGGPIPDAVRPVFVTIMEHGPRRGQDLERAVSAVTAVVAETTGHPRANVHVVFTPPAAGRVAFGGRIVE
jgi:phenylpyruvate tautomerase PptA (4-oxalocrotonate tautomerase family)